MNNGWIGGRHLLHRMPRDIPSSRRIEIRGRDRVGELIVGRDRVEGNQPLYFSAPFFFLYPLPISSPRHSFVVDRIDEGRKRSTSNVNP